MGLSKDQQCDIFRASVLNRPGNVFSTKDVQALYNATRGQAVCILDMLRDYSQVSQLSEHYWRANRPSRELLARKWV